MKENLLHAKENRKKKIFILKVLLYFSLLVFSDRIIHHLAPHIGTIDNIILSAEFFLAGNLIVSLGRIITVRLYLRKKERSSHHSNFVLGINRIAGIINTVILLITLMILLGIRPLQFLSSITIVAAAIALLSKDYITNMINGLIIMFSDQITLGDHIKIGEHKGRILDITLLNIILVNEDDDMVMIPNSLILSSQVINHSRQNIRKLTFEFETKMAHPVDVNELESRFKKILIPHKQQVNLSTFVLKTMAIQKDALKFKIQFQLNSTNRETERAIRRIMNQGIIEIATENG